MLERETDRRSRSVRPAHRPRQKTRASPAAKNRVLDGLGRSDRLWLGLFVALYAAVALLLFSRLGLFDSGRLPGCACEDPVNQVWFLAFARESLSTAHLPFWTDLMGAPVGFNAASSASFPLLGALASPLTSAVGPIATYNLLSRLGLFVSAMSGCLVLRRLLHNSAAAGVGGMVYGFSPYTIHVVQLHMFLAWVPLPPVILYLLYRQLVQQTGRPFVTGISVGALVAAQYLIDPEIAASVVLIACAVAAVIAAGPLLGGLPLRRGALASASAVTIAAAVVALVLLAYPVWQFLYGPDHVDKGLTQASQGSGIPAITTLLAPSAPTVAHNLAGKVNSLAGRIGLLPTRATGLFGNTGYLGPVLIVALAWIAIRCRRWTLVRVSTVLLAVAWVLALGPHLVGVHGVTHVWLPMRWITHIPTLSNLVAGRLTLYMWLAVAVLIAVDVDRLIIRVRTDAPPRATAYCAAAALLAVIGFTLAGPDGQIQSYPTGPVKPFLGDRIQARIPTGGLVLTYPYPAFPYDTPMLWQAADDDRFKLVGGYAKFRFHGTDIANVVPTLLKPRLVECFLAQAQYPQADWHAREPGGCPLDLITLAPGQLRRFVATNKITSIVVEQAGADPHRVIQAVAAAYGQPAVDPPFYAWRTRGADPRPLQ